MNEDNPIIIKIEAGQETLNLLGEAVQSVRVLTLADTIDPIIGEVNKAIVFEDRIYLLDSHKAKMLFVYDQEGNFRLSIGRNGRGPGEYLIPAYFDIDRSRKEIVILDPGLKKLVSYDLAGKFLYETNLPFHTNDFIILDGQRILLDSGNTVLGEGANNRLTVIDRSTGATVANFFEIDQQTANVNHSPYSPLFRSEEAVLYQPPTSNRLYEIRDNNAIERVVFDFGNKWPARSYLTQASRSTQPRDVLRTMIDLGYVLFLNILENEKFILAHYYYREKYYLAIFDKQNETSDQVLLAEGMAACPMGVHDDEFIFTRISTEGNISLCFLRFNPITNPS